ncbi:MAG TPA: arginine deiminase family protein [Methanobacterium sp.]
MKAKITAEWDNLRKVAVHSPGVEMYFGLLDPFASLYERSFSMKEAIREHELLTYTLKHEFKVDIIPLKETILNKADKSPLIREKLINLANEKISYTGNPEEVKYARYEAGKNRDVLDSNYYFDTFLLNPQVELESGVGTRMIQLHVTENEPLSNLYFMRDQQVVTDRGIVMSRMSKPQRQREPELTKFLWNTLNIPIASEIKKPGTFEGGDFLPMKEFALLGVGDRSNMFGVDQVINYGLGYSEVGVVHQPKHPLIPENKTDPMMNMHLDTYFNIASDGVVVGCEMLLKEADVEIYKRESSGDYIKSDEHTNLYDYIVSKGFEIIDITTLEYLAYASNFLCVKNGTIIAVEVDRIVKDVINNLINKAELDPETYGNLLKQVKKDYDNLRREGQFFPHKKEIYQHDIDAFPLNLINLTGGYGGAHCMTCALYRN